MFYKILELDIHFSFCFKYYPRDNMRENLDNGEKELLTFVTVVPQSSAWIYALTR